MHIGNVKLENRLVLAPLAGMLRLPLRLTYREFGAAMTCVGVIDAKAIAESNGEKLINIGGKEEITNDEERPVSVQLIGSEISKVVAAAKRIEKIASIIDLNFSCPIQRVLEQGHGASLLRDPGRIAEIVGAVVKSVSVPVTAKIRIGIQGNDVDVLQIARNCETAGASAITVHARSASERYSGPVHWDYIRRVKENVGIPVVGNGGVHSAFDAREMIERTSCDLVMIGTSALINPLIFYETNELLRTGTLPKTNQVMALARFARQYCSFAKRTEPRRKAGLMACWFRLRRMRSYMKNIQNGSVTLT